MEMQVITLACFSISKLTGHYLAVKKPKKKKKKKNHLCHPIYEGFLESMKI